jgi:hypothetical protein
MQWFRLRPTFEILLSEDRASAMQKLALEYEKLRQPNSFFMHGEYGELHLPPEEHRLWSPHLSFYVTERNQACLIHGRFAPRMDVWTFIWIIYLAMSFIAFYGFALAYSQWMLGEPIWGIWVALSSLLSIFSLYLIAHVGQQLSADQMHALRERLVDIMHNAQILPADQNPA